MVIKNSLQIINTSSTYFFKSKISIFIVIFFIFLDSIWSTKNYIFSDKEWISKLTFSNISQIDDPFTIFISFIKIFNLFLPIIILSLCERLVTRKISLKRLSSSESYNNADFWYFFISFIPILFPFFTTLITVGVSPLGPKLANWFLANLELFLKNTELRLQPGPFDFLFILISILIYDFYKYISHYIMHKVPFIWDYHELHHSATEMTILNDKRSSFLETAFVNILLAPLVAISAFLSTKYLAISPTLPVVAYGLYFASSKYTAFLSHSSVKCIYPKPISYFLMSPSLHWIHHSKNPKHYDSNFGILFPYWDKIFGTYLGEENLKDIKQFGVEGSDYIKYHPLYSYCIIPLVKTSKRIRKFLSIST